jgi:hypothetical protein
VRATQPPHCRAQRLFDRWPRPFHPNRREEEEKEIKSARVAGLPPPPESEGLEGISLLPALLAPANETAHGKTVAFSQ